MTTKKRNCLNESQYCCVVLRKQVSVQGFPFCNEPVHWPCVKQRRDVDVQSHFRAMRRAALNFVEQLLLEMFSIFCLFIEYFLYSPS